MNKFRKKHREALGRLTDRWLMFGRRRISATDFTYDIENELKRFNKDELGLSKKTKPKGNSKELPVKKMAVGLK